MISVLIATFFLKSDREVTKLYPYELKLGMLHISVSENGAAVAATVCALR